MEPKTLSRIIGAGLAVAVATTYMGVTSVHSAYERGRKEGLNEMQHATASYLLNHAAVHRNAGSSEDTIRANELEATANTITESDSEEFIRENGTQSAEAVGTYGSGL